MSIKLGKPEEHKVWLSGPSTLRKGETIWTPQSATKEQLHRRCLDTFVNFQGNVTWGQRHLVDSLDHSLHAAHAAGDIDMDWIFSPGAEGRREFDITAEKDAAISAAVRDAKSSVSDLLRRSVIIEVGSDRLDYARAQAEDAIKGLADQKSEPVDDAALTMLQGAPFPSPMPFGVVFISWGGPWQWTESGGSPWGDKSTMLPLGWLIQDEVIDGQRVQRAITLGLGYSDTPSNVQRWMDAEQASPALAMVFGGSAPESFTWHTDVYDAERTQRWSPNSRTDPVLMSWVLHQVSKREPKFSAPKLSDKMRAKKATKAARREGHKAGSILPRPWYQVENPEGVIPEGPQSSAGSGGKHRYRYSVAAHMSSRVHRGQGPIDAASAKRLESMGYEVFRPGQALSLRALRILQRKGLDLPAPGEWIAAKEWPVKQATKGPKDAPFIPSTRRVA